LLDEPAYYTVVGFIDDHPYGSSDAGNGARVLGNAEDLGEIVQVHDIDEILLAVADASIERQQELIGACMEIGVRWRLVPNLAGLLHERVEIDSVGGLPVVGLRGSRVVGYNWTLKRTFDVIVAAASGLLLAVPMIAIALAVKLNSPGPVLYRQTRVGFKGDHFTLLKFRTMRADSDADVHERYVTDWIFGKTGATSPSVEESRSRAATTSAMPVHKLVDDPRVTPVGRALRATSLDELPQLWNVLRGQMSIVGPRPPLPYEVERYTEAHKRRFEVLPGITGLWQVSGRNRLSFEDMVRLDISYIENWSLREDMRIVARTLPALVTERGR
jgi:exopolysaccharide biosynthesis polyprenyl glycosylphosphotransferase